MRGTKRATWTWLLAMLLAGGIGFGAGALQREAYAQSIATSTIYVPAGGLVFRAADGTPLARLLTWSSRRQLRGLRRSR